MKSNVILIKPINFILLLVLIALLFNSLSLCHRPCGSGFLKTHRVLSKPPGETTRYLSEDKWESLRIHLDYSFIENNIGKFDKQDLIDLKEKIMPKTAQVLQNLLKVRRLKTKLRFSDTMCEQYPIPEKYEINSDGVDADLVIFVIIDDTGFFLQNRIEAAAIHCLQHSETRRPIAGYIQFKPQLGVTDQTAVDYMVWLALHEITHILAFNDGLYQDFIDKDLNPIGENSVLERRNQNGRQITYIKSPNVVMKAREHFNCDTLTGVPLEYNGGPGTAGAHWAKKFMNTDYMIGDSYGENLFSPITLALFNDSGWYQVEYGNANLFLWGKNEGCGFLDFNKKCIGQGSSQMAQNTYGMTTPYKIEFCTNFNKQICSTSNIFRGRCLVKRFERDLPNTDQYFDQKNIGGIDPLTEHCPIVIEEKNGENYYGGSCRVGSRMDISDYETIGPTSVCFMSSLYIGDNQFVDDDVTVTDEKNRIRKKENVVFRVQSNKFRFLRIKSNQDKQKEVKKEGVNLVKNKSDISEIKKESVINKTSSELNKEIKEKASNTIKPIETKPNTNSIKENLTKNKNHIENKETKIEPKQNKSTNLLKKSPPSTTPTIPQNRTIKDTEFRKIKVNSETFNKTSSYKSACIKFSCNDNGYINIHIKGKTILCAETGATKVPGYNGEVLCPPRDILCNESFMCKFGCVERYAK